MEKEKSKKKSSCSSDIGEILAQSLTKGQIASLLDVVFAAGDAACYLDSLRESDPDMAQTVERVLKIDSGQPQEVSFSRIASDESILESWNSLWNRWEDVVFDVGGKYTTTERVCFTFKTYCIDCFKYRYEEGRNFES